MAGGARSIGNVGVLVLVTSNRAPECSGGLSHILAHAGGASLDNAVAGDIFAGSPLRLACDDQLIGDRFLFHCGSSSPAANRRQIFFGSRNRASSLTLCLAAADGRSAVYAAGVSSISDHGKMVGTDGAKTFCNSLRGTVCIQFGLDESVSGLVVGAVADELCIPFHCVHELCRRSRTRVSAPHKKCMNYQRVCIRRIASPTGSPEIASTNPISRARTAEIFSAEMKSSSALPFPIKRGKRCVPPHPVMRPRAAPRCPNTAWGAAILL